MNIFHLRGLFLKHKAFETEDCKILSSTMH